MANNKTIRRPSGDNTRQAIIDAANDLFCSFGFSGTSLMQIANKAQINKSLILHHFETKENLWKQVKASFLNTGSEIDELTPQKDFISFIDHLVAHRFMLYDKNPGMARMISWQRLEKDSTQLEGTDKPVFNHYIEMIKNFQANKEVRNDLEAKFIMLWISVSISGIFLVKEKPFKNKTQKLIYKDMVIQSILSTLSNSR